MSDNLTNDAFAKMAAYVGIKSGESNTVFVVDASQTPEKVYAFRVMDAVKEIDRLHIVPKDGNVYLASVPDLNTRLLQHDWLVDFPDIGPRFIYRVSP